MSNRIGIDLGGTKIDAITLSETGETLFEKRVATPKSYDAVVAAIRDLVLEAGEGSVGIGSPGSNSRKTNLWRNSNLLFCNGKPFQHDLETAIGRSVRMENDANCFALSEAIDGAGQGYPVVAFFTIGTALGGGLVVNGKVSLVPIARQANLATRPCPGPMKANGRCCRAFAERRDALSSMYQGPACSAIIFASRAKIFREKKLLRGRGAVMRRHWPRLHACRTGLRALRPTSHVLLTPMCLSSAAASMNCRNSWRNCHR